MKFGVKIMPREVILDTQGRAVEKSLKPSYETLKQVRIGRYVELTLEGSAKNTEEELVKKMTEGLLYNPLIETYEIQRIP